MSRMRNIVKLFRCKHYIKNMLIFIVPVFTGTIFRLSASVYIQYLCVFALFSLMSSAVYIFNDLLDVEADRLDPVKSLRPIASGAVSKSSAIAMCIALALGSAFLSLLINYQVTLVLVGYLVLNILYSLWWKHIPIVDMIILSLGFVCRLYAGAAIEHIALSRYLLLTIWSAAMYLAASKRFVELKQNADVRRVLASYTQEFLLSVMTIFLGLAFAVYSVWMFTYAGALNQSCLFISFFFLVWTMIAYHREVMNGALENPVDLFLHDKGLVVGALGYSISIVVAVLL